jgi:hypothetical protein
LVTSTARAAAELPSVVTAARYRRAQPQISG